MRLEKHLYSVTKTAPFDNNIKENERKKATTQWNITKTVISKQKIVRNLPYFLAILTTCARDPTSHRHSSGSI